jgi:integrase/recombinase XerD
VRVPRTLPKILQPAEADRLLAALRTDRDRAIVLVIMLAGLRRHEVLGLRFEDVQVADRRLVVVEGKGGHHWVVPASNRFFDVLGGYLHDERPDSACTSRVFAVLKGPRRGQPLSAEGLDENPGRPPPGGPGPCHLPLAVSHLPDQAAGSVTLQVSWPDFGASWPR